MPQKPLVHKLITWKSKLKSFEKRKNLFLASCTCL